MNGGGEINGWLCGHNSDLKRLDGCKPGEWCTGPYTIETATANYNELCVAGKNSYLIQSIIVKSYVSMDHSNKVIYLFISSPALHG